MSKRRASNAPLEACLWVRIGFAASAVVIVLATPALGQLNDCSDPYWIDSLRCQADPSPGTLVPQPPPDPVTSPSQIEDFTRVELDGDPSIRCADGTVPILYVDAAEGVASSDSWVISVPGGGACNAGDDGSGNLTDGQRCLDQYLDGEAGEMSTAAQPLMRSLGTTGGPSDGILSSDVATNPVFSGYHRVRVQKCSYDSYNGRSTRTLDAVHPLHGAVQYDLHQHGQRIFVAALDALRSGLSYDLYEDDGSGGVAITVDGVTLPALEDAERVFLVAHSGGANGMVQNADRLREHLESWTPFGRDVRAVFDANLLPALENEAAFATPVLGDLYDHIRTGVNPTVAPATGVYDASYYSDPTSGVRVRFRAYLEDGGALDDIFDASCIAAHPGEEWVCVDRYHVLFNHVATPMLLRQDLSDPNNTHTLSGFGHLPAWGEVGDYCHCGPLGLDPCIPLVSVDDFQARLIEQIDRFELDAETRSELATGADPSGVMPTRYVYAPDCRNHGGIHNNEGYFLTSIDTGTQTIAYREYLELFWSAPAIGASDSIVHGRDGASSICPTIPDPPPPPIICPEVPTAAPIGPLAGLLLVFGTLAAALSRRR